MSSGAVAQLIEEMEGHLQQADVPDSDYLEQWNAKFSAAVEALEAAGAAGRGPDWGGIVERANRLAETIQRMVAGLCFERDQIRDELALQSSGRRALKGYAPGAN
jgi:hypothetical protein